MNAQKLKPIHNNTHKHTHLLVNHQFGEHQVSLVEHGIRVLVIDGAVHQRMRADEVQHRIRQARRIVDARARPWFRDLALEHRQPGAVRSGLLLEFACNRKGNGEKSDEKRYMNSR